LKISCAAFLLSLLTLFSAVLAGRLVARLLTDGVACTTQALCMAWLSELWLASGGADCKLVFHSLARQRTAAE
jgi:hypothetical protein